MSNARTNDETERTEPAAGDARPDGNGSKEFRLERALRRVVADMTDVRRQRDDARGQLTRAIRARDEARHERDEAVADLNVAAAVVQEASRMVRELLALPTRDRWRGSWIAEAVLSVTPPLRDVADLLDGGGREDPDTNRKPDPPAPSPAPQPAEELPAAATLASTYRTPEQSDHLDAPTERCHNRYDDDCMAANPDHCRRLGHPEHATRCPHPHERPAGLL
jgi:hypothetical protein